MYLRENETDPSIKTAFENAVKQGQGDRRKKTEELWARQKLPEVEELRRENGRVWARIEAQNFGGMTGERYFQKKINEVLREANPDQREPWAENMHEYWRKTRHRLGENRFLMTLLLAAAERRMLAAASPLEGADDARRFITATVDLVRNDGADKREETVLRAVLESYAARHQIGDPEADFELHQLILRHLGVVGAPMAVDVMVRLPEFRDYFDRLSVPLPYSRRRFLARSLTDLTHRGLIFRLSPHPRLMELEAKTHGDSSDWPVTEKHRFALHRIVQRHALTRLGIGTNDAVAVGSFAPTLSAAIPSPGTGLSEEGYGFVRSLMIGLSQYPDIPQDDDRLRPWLFTTKDANIRIQALRASLTLARSTISLPVFAAFNAYETDGPGLPKRGFLDTYKVRLRWIIRHAWESVHREKNQPQTGSAPTAAPTNSATLNALYRDETVWLYNELGVVALAQGNLTEALGFLRLAREFNEEIEGHARRGPIFDRIALNYAVVQLERGRLFSAERSLDQVLKSPHADATLHNLADGYCALLDHIRGRNEGVDERFTRVTKDLEGRGELRGAALLKMHHAQLIAEIDPLRGLELSNRAHDLAEIGSQEDIRQRAELVRIMLEYRTSNIGNSDEMRWSQRALDVENYGRRMGSWSLQVDALRLRAEHMLAFGETALAGQLLVRAMAISRRNRMMLRLNGTMTQYARALMLRRDRLSALAVATKSLALAKSIQYGLEEARTTQLVMQIESGLDAGAITTAQLPI
jgi:tetratricopeptide (TPR) repeat protein